MAATVPLDLYAHITQDSRICSGRPCIAGTRVRVMDVVLAHEAGHTPEQLQGYFSTRELTLGEIHAALAYYHDHKHEIDQAFAEDEHLTDQIQREQAEPPAPPRPR